MFWDNWCQTVASYWSQSHSNIPVAGLCPSMLKRLSCTFHMIGYLSLWHYHCTTLFHAPPKHCSQYKVQSKRHRTSLSENAQKNLPGPIPERWLKDDQSKLTGLLAAADIFHHRLVGQGAFQVLLGCQLVIMMVWCTVGCPHPQVIEALQTWPNYLPCNL